MKRNGFGFVVAAAAGLSIAALSVGPATADDKAAVPDPAFEKQFQEGKEFKEGKWVLPNGDPTYDVKRNPENTDHVIQVDWHTYSGWRRYHAECHQCHGPNAEGSTFAPALKDSLKRMSYEQFLQIVASGQSSGPTSVMPALGDNPNVMCYIEDLYVYIRARSTDALQGGRLSPDQRAEKPKEAVEYEKDCLGR